MRGFIKKKSLINKGAKESPTDSTHLDLLTFLQVEAQEMHDHLTEEYRDYVITELWNTMQGELLAWFDLKKKRNQVKNKPARFQHIKTDLPIILCNKLIQHLDLGPLDQGKSSQDVDNEAVE